MLETETTVVEAPLPEPEKTPVGEDAPPKAGEGLRKLARAAKKAKAEGRTIPLP